VIGGSSQIIDLTLKNGVDLTLSDNQTDTTDTTKQKVDVSNLAKYLYDKKA